MFERCGPFFLTALESTGWDARGKRCAKRNQQGSEPVDFIAIFSIFILACFVGYFVVWSVTPALHTPLMSVTNAISSVIIVGALIASAAAGSASSKWLGLAAVVMASINIFGGFAVTARMLAMYKKKER
jgi:NAD(P) transhydrogenase subunit alpha